MGAALAGSCRERFRRGAWHGWRDEGRAGGRSCIHTHCRRKVRGRDGACRAVSCLERPSVYVDRDPSRSHWGQPASHSPAKKQRLTCCRRGRRS
jgi:hypothetical protein